MSVFKRMNALSGKATLSKLFCLPFENDVFFKRKKNCSLSLWSRLETVDARYHQDRIIWKSYGVHSLQFSDISDSRSHQVVKWTCVQFRASM